MAQSSSPTSDYGSSGSSSKPETGFGSRSSSQSGSSAAETATERVQSMANDAREQMNAVGGNVKKAVDKSIQDQPMTTLLVAVGVGVVIGALWKS
jgi:ElaB/YqjD/DUF883 family membrane-anchored ribosome-binding protein